MGPQVYFMRPVGADGPTKIGHSMWPDNRLAKTYAHWSPLPLEMLATISGGLELERRFHARFLHLRSHHEWFRASPEIDEAIAAILAGNFDLESLPRDGVSLSPSRKGIKLTEAEKAQRRAARGLG